MFEKLVVENFSNLTKDIKIFKKLSKLQTRYPKKSKPRQTIVKLLKTKGTEINLESSEKEIEIGKAGIRAACHYQTPSAGTGIESSWALHSHGQGSEKVGDLYPNVVHFLTRQLFYNREQSAARGFEIQGELDCKNLQHSRSEWLAVSDGWTVICLSLEQNGVDVSSCAQEGMVSGTCSS